jgi:hypothetical protein
LVIIKFCCGAFVSQSRVKNGVENYNFLGRGILLRWIDIRSFLMVAMRIIILAIFDQLLCHRSTMLIPTLGS